MVKICMFSEERLRLTTILKIVVRLALEVQIVKNLSLFVITVLGSCDILLTRS